MEELLVQLPDNNGDDCTIRFKREPGLNQVFTVGLHSFHNGFKKVTAFS